LARVPDPNGRRGARLSAPIVEMQRLPHDPTRLLVLTIARTGPFLVTMALITS
jgi:hypothetical protein